MQTAETKKKILLGVTGGIAAYKIPGLVRLLKKAGMDVQVLMTPTAHQFVTAESLSVVSERPVYTDFFNDETGTWNNHVDLGLWPDLMLICPATATTLGKMASGISDNLLLTTYLSARCPVYVAPAMDLDMYVHPAVKQTLLQLENQGVHIIPADTGELASGLSGQGRMPEPETLFRIVSEYFTEPSKPLSGQSVLITAGPTYENIDPVRFIGNHSSGKMGFALAEEFHSLGASVHLISGPVALKAPNGVKTTFVRSALEMQSACMNFFQDSDIVVMAAAVADYRPVSTYGQKIKKTDDKLTIELVKNPDILAEMGEKKKPGQTLVGFALETHDELNHAQEKMKRKNLDMIVLNSLNDPGAAFGHDTNKVSILTKEGEINAHSLKTKKEVAKDIAHFIVKYRSNS
jgi:phosphopantothenoylcysteine decarboxylase/phosphopantothenate--cysteine ligase